MRSKILVVEDDTNMSSSIKQWLEGHQYTVEVVANGSEALSALKFYKFDLVILDWELPDLSGLNICQQFRTQGGTIPILMLTGRAAISEKEAGFDAGADDYLTKPFDLRELTARVNALLRRPITFQSRAIELGNVVLETNTFRLTVNGRDVQILPKEFALLQFLMRHPAEIFSADALLDRIWPSDSDATSNTVRTFMYTLRKKLKSSGATVEIETVYGVGYRLAV